jgi:quinol monooxygenase YgiN
MIITKKVVFIAKDDSIEELKALLTDMVKPSQAEEGCLLYEIYQVNAKPNTFVVIESWESEAALDGHKHSAHYAHYKAHFEPYTADKYSDELTALI